MYNLTLLFAHFFTHTLHTHFIVNYWIVIHSVTLVWLYHSSTTCLTILSSDHIIVVKLSVLILMVCPCMLCALLQYLRFHSIRHYTTTRPQQEQESVRWFYPITNIEYFAQWYGGGTALETCCVLKLNRTFCGTWDSLNNLMETSRTSLLRIVLLLSILGMLCV